MLPPSMSLQELPYVAVHLRKCCVSWVVFIQDTFFFCEGKLKYSRRRWICNARRYSASVTSVRFRTLPGSWVGISVGLDCDRFPSSLQPVTHTPFLTHLTMPLSCAIPILIAVAFLTLVERKILSYIPARKGPNIVGPFGLLQPVADRVELFSKEPVRLSTASPLPFIVTPLLALLLASTI